ncbi:2-dehydro-3-deoxygalactonokinase [Flavihumibacter fluvii]|uniref:2-dehydro-3-deoxygalactonokinase n=1 Tax=Flavihumibacter fluvii TaxID=2838157 RepID=UPI001BDE553B|nr:2-dehydro-3-deoxygalactonokinase [Flavihumibacter fluvii]ULQ54045.1 2-dehydro-3-deoxygalactonokinase [Flavihumibacter fluvii]
MVKHILSCDWGTTSFRLRLVQVETRNILAETTSGVGIAAVYKKWLAARLPESERIHFYQRELQVAIDEISHDAKNDAPVFISGMASSTIGMKVITYGTVPFDLLIDLLPWEKIPANETCPHDTFLFSGLQTSNDVMRGEETILLGAKMHTAFETMVIFPGTHSKHALVKDNMIIGFNTFMTGEFFDLLVNKSILSASVQCDPGEIDVPAFRSGVLEGANGNMLNTAFHVRTNQLFNRLSPNANYHYLSGLVIGAELKDLSGSSAAILLVSGPALAVRYRLALNIMGFEDRLQTCDADQALVEGHCQLAARCV